MAWRFLRDMGGMGSPTLCLGFRDSLQAVCPGAHSSYNEGLGRAEVEEGEVCAAVAVGVSVLRQTLCTDRRCVR